MNRLNEQYTLIKQFTLIYYLKNIKCKYKIYKIVAKLEFIKTHTVYHYIQISNFTGK